VFKGAQQPIYLFADKNFEGPTELLYTTILYDGAVPYMQRLATCIEQVKEPYFILSHENDILLQYDASAMNASAAAMKEHNIDSIDLKHHDTPEERIQITPSLFISNVIDPFIFRVQPRIWKKGSAIKLFSANSGKTYRRAENSNVQASIKSQKQKTYEAYSANSVPSWYFAVHNAIPEYLFIHITNGNKFIPMPQTKGKTVDPMVQKELDAIQVKYIDSQDAKREQADANFDPYEEVYNLA
jgi:hypothetical protein